MISALRGWRRKQRKAFKEWDLEFEKWITKTNKRALMVKVNGVRYGRPQYFHKGRKP